MCFKDGCSDDVLEYISQTWKNILTSSKIKGWIKRKLKNNNNQKHKRRQEAPELLMLRNLIIEKQSNL